MAKRSSAIQIVFVFPFELPVLVMNIHLVFPDDDEKLPTTLSELIDKVVTKGEIYEEKILLRKNELPSAFW